jgi:predicted NAD/FAD-binding protein
MKIAVVGTGISGLTAAYLLHPEHEITVFEAQDRIGGHTVTSQIGENGGSLAVDAGFIVYNEANYPNFVKLLSRLGVQTQPSSMSFSVRCDRTGLEYAGTNLNTLFAQRSNLFNPGFYGLLGEILRFNRAATKALGNGVSEGLGGTLGDFLHDNRLTERLADQYLIPLTAAIWSTDPKQVLETPARFILTFLDNHNLLGIGGHHQWRVIKGGSERYVEKLVAAFRDRIRLSSPVRRLERRLEDTEGVAVSTDAGTELFDEVIVAAHSQQALSLHTDASVLPRKKSAWASWNYRTPRESGSPVAVTYNMTELQSLPTDAAYCVSLNMRDDITDENTLESFDFEHPLFSEAAVAAQKRHHEISGIDGIHYCGAYWRNGFHEDGVVSAIEATRKFGVTL